MDYGEGNVVICSNNHDVIKNLIANNLAVGIYTEFWIKDDPLVMKGDIVTIPYYDKKYSAMHTGYALIFASNRFRNSFTTNPALSVIIKEQDLLHSSRRRKGR